MDTRSTKLAPAAPAPRSAATMLVATRHGLRAPSLAAAAPGAELLDGRRVDAVSTAGDGTVWALADRSELVRVVGGAAETVARLPDGSAGCVHVHGGSVFVGGDDAGLWRLHGEVLAPVASFREAPTRPAWSTPWGGPPSVFSMASHGEDLYVSVHVGGILRSGDGGTTWTATIDLDDDVHQVAVDPGDGTLWAATGRRGLARSTDRGRSWTYHADGLHATYLLAVAVADDGVLVAASSGHAGRDGAVYRFDGTRFQPVAGLPDPLGGAVGPRQLAAAGAVAAVATPDGGLHASGDGGRTWSPTGVRLDGVTEVHVG